MSHNLFKFEKLARNQLTKTLLDFWASLLTDVLVLLIIFDAEYNLSIVNGLSFHDGFILSKLNKESHWL